MPQAIREKDQGRQGGLDAYPPTATHPLDRIEQADGLQILLLTGVGQVYPFIRTHSVLNNLQRVAKDYPTLLFFPGEYTFNEGRGQSLDLFGVLNEDKYYRAFNIMEYKLPS